ncbi:MAG: sugar phosphate isomerase/epimerase [Kiritimatiellae bacterium]|nr:sugar phosphate isomerase/epimerase [Kiritimatiellia bacterium]
MAYMTGFADEAAADLDGQIRATKALGWQNIEARKIGGKMIHDLSAAEFDAVYGRLQDAGVTINCFGSAIANWGKQITDPFDSSLAECRRAIPMMKKLGTKLVRIMSFAVLKGRGPEDQMEAERFKRVRELQKLFGDEGLIPVHENCMNYGGMGWTYTLRLIENVPGLKLVFDTGNPLSSTDHTKNPPVEGQSSWEFYSHVKEHVAYIHIKDGRKDPATGKVVWGWCGEGDGDVAKIVGDMLAGGYDGGISIEPHMKVVHHDAEVAAAENAKYANYVEYGRRMMKIVEAAR